MSAYHRLISYIYAYEGGVKGKNIGFAKLETRGTSCRIQVGVRRIFAGASPIGVYLLAGQDEIRIGTLFARGGNGEFRTVVNNENVEGSGCSMEECCGLTLHETDSAWRAYTTIWEDAVAHAAEVELADVTAGNVRQQEAEKEKKPQQNPYHPVRKLAERAQEAENQNLSIETEKEGDANIEEVELETLQSQPPEGSEDSNLDIFEDTEAMETVPDIPEAPGQQEAESVQGTQTKASQESSQESAPEAQTEALQESSQESVWEVRKETPPDFQPDHQKRPQPEPSKESPGKDPAESLWNRLRAAYPKVTAFECTDGCEILVIKPQDIGLLPRENWVYGNNSFLLHGYYNYRYLILARLGKSGEQGRYILGVPGHYGNNEKYMAAMFGFEHFVRSTRQPPRDSRFGYWYTDLNFT